MISWCWWWQVRKCFSYSDLLEQRDIFTMDSLCQIWEEWNNASHMNPLKCLAFSFWSLSQNVTLSASPTSVVTSEVNVSLQCATQEVYDRFILTEEYEKFPKLFPPKINTLGYSRPCSQWWVLLPATRGGCSYTMDITRVSPRCSQRQVATSNSWSQVTWA